MTSNSKPYPQRNRKWRWTALALGIVGSMSLALAMISFFGKQNYEAIALVFYALLATAFLAAQVFGFVFSQSHYSEEWEEAKYLMLENEAEPR